MFLQPAVPAAAAGASKHQPSCWASQANAVCMSLHMTHPSVIQKCRRTIKMVNRKREGAQCCSNSRLSSSNPSFPVSLHMGCKVLSSVLQRWEAGSWEGPEESLGPPSAVKKYISCELWSSQVPVWSGRGKLKDERWHGGESDYPSLCWWWDAYDLRWEARSGYVSGCFIFSRKAVR